MSEELPFLETHVRSWWTVHVRDSKRKPYYQRGGIYEDFETACKIAKNIYPARVAASAQIVCHTETAVVVPIP